MTGASIGITLTVLACVAALGTWGRSAQVAAIVCLGLAAIIADVKRAAR